MPPPSLRPDLRVTGLHPTRCMDNDTNAAPLNHLDNETLAAWEKHCTDQHPSPIWANMPGRATQVPETTPTFCPDCRCFAPSDWITAWHHTSPESAQKLLASEPSCTPDRWLYCVASPEMTGFAPKHSGASVRVHLYAPFTRIDGIFPQRREIHLRCAAAYFQPVTDTAID